MKAKRLFFSLLIVVTLSSIGYSQSNPNPERRDIISGLKLLYSQSFENNNFGQSLDYINKIINYADRSELESLDIKWHKLMLDKAYCLINMGRMEDANQVINEIRNSDYDQITLSWVHWLEGLIDNYKIFYNLVSIEYNDIYKVLFGFAASLEKEDINKSSSFVLTRGFIFSNSEEKGNRVSVGSRNQTDNVGRMKMEGEKVVNLYETHYYYSDRIKFIQASKTAELKDYINKYLGISIRNMYKNFKNRDAVRFKDKENGSVIFDPYYLYLKKVNGQWYVSKLQTGLDDYAFR